MKKISAFLLLFTFFLLFKSNVYALKIEAKEISTASDFIAELSTTDDSNIKLTSDLELNKTAAIKKNVSIDLNGHSLKFNLTIKHTAFNISSTGTLTLEDSKKSGMLSANTGWMFYVNGGHIIVKSGNYTINNDTGETKSAKYMFYSSKGKVDILGGHFNATGDMTTAGSKTTFYMFYINKSDLNLGNETTKDTDIVVDNNFIATTNYMIMALSNSSINIFAGTYNTRDYLLYVLGYNRDYKVITNIKGENFNTTSTGTSIFLLDYSKTTFTDGEINSKGYGIVLSSLDHLIADPAIELIVGDNKGGEPRITSDLFAISGNHLKPGTKITINNGKIVSKKWAAIYHPQQGIFTLNGGLIQGKTGISAKMGQFVFNGGTVAATGECNSATISSKFVGGNDNDGAALSLSTEIYQKIDGVEEEYGNSLSVTMNDGVFISKNSDSIILYDWNIDGQEQKVDININNGRFTNFPVTKIATYDATTGESTITTTKKYLYVDKENTNNNKEFNWVPQAYYEHGKLDYSYQPTDAPYYAKLITAVEDNEIKEYNNKNNIYYLQGKINDGIIGEYTKIISDWDTSKKYVPEAVTNIIGDNKTFERDTLDLKMDHEGYTAAEILEDEKPVGYLYFPVITFDSNEGNFENNTKLQKTIVTSVSKIVTENTPYITLDDGNKLNIKTDNLLEIPQNPTKKGKTFIGWYYDKDSTNRPVDLSASKIQQNIVVYAHYSNTPVNESSESNPNTLDKVVLYIIGLIVSLIYLRKLTILYKRI